MRASEFVEIEMSVVEFEMSKLFFLCVALCTNTAYAI